MIFNKRKNRFEVGTEEWYRHENRWSDMQKEWNNGSWFEKLIVANQMIATPKHYWPDIPRKIYALTWPVSCIMLYTTLTVFWIFVVAFVMLPIATYFAIKEGIGDFVYSWYHHAKSIWDGK